MVSFNNLHKVWRATSVVLNFHDLIKEMLSELVEIVLGERGFIRESSVRS